MRQSLRAVVHLPGHPAQIVRFWQAVEIFSPQQLPRREARKHVCDIKPGEPMPWEPGSRLPAAHQDKVWRHQVYGGVYELSRVSDVLVARFGQDDAETPGASGESALFGCTVDADGCLAEQSTVLSACAWAVGQVVRDRPSPTGFDQDALRYADELARVRDAKGGFRLLAESIRTAVPDAVASGVTAAISGALAAIGGPLAAAGGAMAGNIAGSVTRSAIGGDGAEGSTKAEAPVRLDLAPLTAKDLQRFSAELASKLGVADALRPANVRVRSYEISTEQVEEETEQSFLNSFFADDLARVAAALNRGRVGTALSQYLTSTLRINSVGRIDLQNEPLTVLAGCAPDHIPSGRWVTDTNRPLALSQQFAVNQIMKNLADSPGLFAVNGPPGTGKTTMLRDLVAAIVVNRAIELSCLGSPSEAFTGEPHPWSTDKRTYKISQPAPELTGFEMVVASSNNGAVENVTTEIPGRKGIDATWRNSGIATNYFASTAKLLYGDGAWAMIAARLGNRKNRRDFAQTFWWGGRDGDSGGMRARLGQPSSGLSGWQGAVNRFRRELARVNALSSERAAVSRSISRLPVTTRALERATTDLKTLTAQREQLEARQPAIDQELRDANDSWKAANTAVRTHHLGKPGLLAFLSIRRRAQRRVWNAEHGELCSRFLSADRRRDAASRAADELQREIGVCGAAEEDARARRGELNTEFESLQDVVRQARQRWGDHVPCGSEYSETEQRDLIALREMSAPWADEELSRARTELFLTALELHKALIEAEAVRFRANLDALMDILTGKGHPEPAGTLAAWQTLFLVVPVVSSTFASIDRLFTGLGQESLGWLLIDEAGQAPPQYAVGAIWRAHRAVVVGDPLQLKPIVTLPWGGQRALLREFGVAEEWAPSRTSVQQVADRLARYGTSLPDPTPGKSAWVGSPLRVHRRCDRPMFDVSNSIAYNGLMVFGTPEREPFYGRDAWIDVRSSIADGHWIPAEGEVLQEVLLGLGGAGIAAAKIRVLSPFCQVVSEAVKKHQSIFPEVTDKDRKRWVGTVHTMQGKEADVVILVLGGNPNRPGARRFAVEAPNLLNVAVSRARRRLYVIGNYQTWGSEEYFCELVHYIRLWRR
jgi:AAA domain